MEFKTIRTVLNGLNKRFIHFVGSSDFSRLRQEIQKFPTLNLRMATQHQVPVNPTKGIPIKFSVPSECDYNRLLDFLRNHFYPEEPLTIGNLTSQQDPIDEELVMSNLNHGTCLMALRKNGNKEEVVGAVMAGPKNRHELEYLRNDAAKYTQKVNWGRVLAILVRIENDTNVHENFGVDRVLHVHALAVHRDTRGLAVGVRLMQNLMVLGKSLNFELMTIDCSSHYSAVLCERLSMECINSIRYADFLDENGKQMFHPPPPHEAIKTFAQRL